MGCCATRVSNSEFSYYYYCYYYYCYYCYNYY